MSALPLGRPLTDREHHIILDLARVRLLDGAMLDRLHFSNIDNPRVRSSSRRRTMDRLVDQSLATTLPRRVGGERAGSAGLVYTLDAAGQRLAAQQAWLDRGEQPPSVPRRPWPIGQMFVAHTLAVAELYVRLRERERSADWQLQAFDAEPASWHRTATGLLKPDAFAVWRDGPWEEHRWIEVDRATESLPTIRRKLLAYLDATGAGDLGPRGVLPRVTVTVPSARRLAAISAVADALQAGGVALVSVELFETVFRGPDDEATAARPPPVG